MGILTSTLHIVAPESQSMMYKDWLSVEQTMYSPVPLNDVVRTGESRCTRLQQSRSSRSQKERVWSTLPHANLMG